MERFGRGGELHEPERRRLIEYQLLPNADEALSIVDNMRPLPVVSGRETLLRRSRSAAAEHLKALVYAALQDDDASIPEFTEQHDMLARTQQKISSMRANVVRDHGLKPVVERLSELLQNNERSVESHYRNQPHDSTFNTIGSVLDAQYAVWGVLSEVVHVEDDPADQIGSIRKYIDGLKTARGHRQILLFLDRSIDSLHIMISERDLQLSEPLRPGSYQDILIAAREKLRRSVAQLRGNL